MQRRRERILQEVNNRGSVKVVELSSLLDCSEVTIRNDIRNMDEEGLLVRTHGGAIALEDPKKHRKYNAESLYRKVEEKMEIAAKAYELIDDRDTVIIDDSSACFYLALHIKAHPEKHIIVVTNSLYIGNELCDAEHVELFIIGGHVGGHLSSMMGELAIQNLSQFYVDKCFIGVHGINFNVGLTSVGSPNMQVKKAILKASKKAYVLADSSKFGGGYLSVICPMRDIDKIITDRGISSQYIHEAEQHHTSLVIA